MKKIATIIATVLITSSLSACGNKNTAYRNPAINQGGTNLNIDQRNNIGLGTTTFKDGIYLGEGNKTSQENHAAIVTIRNGKINNVVFKTLDNQGKEITTRSSYYSNTSNTNNTSMGGTAVPNTTGGVVPEIAPNEPKASNPANGVNNNIANNTTENKLTHSERVRQDLANAMISKQTYNVSINNVGNDTFAVDNWKLAVNRALVGAKR